MLRFEIAGSTEPNWALVSEPVKLKLTFVSEILVGSCGTFGVHVRLFLKMWFEILKKMMEGLLGGSLDNKEIMEVKNRG